MARSEKEYWALTGAAHRFFDCASSVYPEPPLRAAAHPMAVHAKEKKRLSISAGPPLLLAAEFTPENMDVNESRRCPLTPAGDGLPA